MAAARRTTRRAGTLSPPGESRRSATGPARRASSRIATSCAAAGAERRRVADGTLDEKGALGRRGADEAGQRDERLWSETNAEDLVANLDDLPGDGRPHDCRPRRPQARAGLHLGVDGRAQARRVRSDPDLPRPLRHRQGWRVEMADENPDKKNSNPDKKNGKKVAKKEQKKAAPKKAAKKAEGKTAAKNPAAKKASKKEKAPAKKEAGKKPGAKKSAAKKAEPKKSKKPVAIVVRASSRYVRVAPRKARLVADQVRSEERRVGKE